MFSSPIIDRGKISPQVSTYVSIVQSDFYSPTPTVAGTTGPSSFPPGILMQSTTGGSMDELRSAHGESRLSTSTVAGSSSTLDIVPSVSTSIPLGNTHTMVTRSKAGIFKPKALSVDAIDYERRTIEEALANLECRPVVQAEFDAFMANSTWELASLP